MEMQKSCFSVLKGNRGEKIERFLEKFLNYRKPEDFEARNVPCTVAADLEKNGIGYQVKGDRASFGLNGYQLTDDKTKDVQALVNHDQSDKFLLAGLWKKNSELHLFEIQKDKFVQMVAENPQVVHYSRNSKKNGGGKSLRLKVQVSKKEIYTRYADKIETIQFVG